MKKREKYRSAHGWFYTYYYASDYIKNYGGSDAIERALMETHIESIKNQIANNPLFISSEDAKRI